MNLNIALQSLVFDIEPEVSNLVSFVLHSRVQTTELHCSSDVMTILTIKESFSKRQLWALLTNYFSCFHICLDSKTISNFLLINNRSTKVFPIKILFQTMEILSLAVAQKS